MQRVDLPALNGRDPLGFLAALGLVALLAEEHDVRLSFDPETATAVLHSPHLDTPQRVADALAHIIGDMQPGQLIPGVTGFPLPGTGARDPHRVPRDDVFALAARVHATGGDPAVSWLLRVVNQFAADARGYAHLTPFMAPRGRQTVETFFARPLHLVAEHPEYLTQALVGWRRVEDCTGENLDARAIVTAAEAQDGVASSRGVPGATWLAVQSLALTRLGAGRALSPIVGTRAQRLAQAAEISDQEGGPDDGRAVQTATLWHWYGPRLGRVMLWPLWSRPLDRVAVETLIHLRCAKIVERKDCPVIVLGTSPPSLGEAEEDAWASPGLDAMGVFTAVAAQRVPTRWDAGPLAPLDLPITLQSPPQR